jgi:predicted dehydrogenase
MSSKARILIIGCGSIGERHLRCFLATGRAEVSACEPNADLAEAMRERYGVEVSGDALADLACGGYEGVVVATPAQTHLPLMREALRAGASVLVEKPLAVTLDEVAESAALLESLVPQGRFARVAYVLHFMPWYAEARAFLRGGTLGRPLQVSVAGGQHFPTFRPAYREIYYARHETGGGAIQDGLTHLLNTVEWFVGPVTRIRCEAAHLALEGVEVEDAVSISARHGEVLASYAYNQFQAPNETRLEIHCERGSLRIESRRQRWGVHLRDGAEWEWRPSGSFERDAFFIAQAKAFLDELEGRPSDLATFEEAAQTLRVNRAALESAATGQTIDL